MRMSKKESTKASRNFGDLSGSRREHAFTRVFWTLLAISFVAHSAAFATVLTFDGTAFGNVTDIPDAYGDRVTTTNDVVNGFLYGFGNGFTPNVVVDYLPDPITGSGQPFTNWISGYGDLDNVLGHLNFNVLGEVVLTPDVGFDVVLNSFEVAAWQVNYPDSRVQVLAGGGAVLFDTGLFDADFSDGHYTFPLSPIVSSDSLRILLFDFGDLGVDNINFDQRVSGTPVPEPGTLVLLGLAMTAFLGHRLRRPAKA